jgi:hypothetical protein
MTIKAALAALFLFTGTALAAPQDDAKTDDAKTDQARHSVSATDGSKGAVTRRQFEQEFEVSAAKLAKNRSGTRRDRFAAFDIAWPRDADEWRRMGGNTVILLGAVSHDATELPLAKAYLERPDGSRVMLKRLGYAKRTLDGSSQAAQVFGSSVTEEFYLVPANALGQGVMLKCDFGKSREGFVVTQSLLPIRALPAKSAPTKPLAGAVQTMVVREYPGFGVTLGDDR